MGRILSLKQQTLTTNSRTGTRQCSDQEGREVAVSVWQEEGQRSTERGAKGGDEGAWREEIIDEVGTFNWDLYGVQGPDTELLGIPKVHGCRLLRHPFSDIVSRSSVYRTPWSNYPKPLPPHNFVSCQFL